ncbi:MAG: flavodoxin family protein [Actinomycetota bacterium]|nr:flavodoxin family protein [Actinomycetota bacterium]
MWKKGPTIKILGISGSPRTSGNTSILLEEALKGARESGAATRKIVVCNREINPCLGCSECFKTGDCVQDDSMNSIYRETTTSHGIILAAPIYFISLNAQTKAMIDRHQCVWARKALLEEDVTDPETRHARRGLFLSTAGADDDRSFDGALRVMDLFFDVLDIKYYERLLFFRIDRKGAIRDHPTALNDAFNAGEHLVTEIARSLGQLMD